MPKSFLQNVPISHVVAFYHNLTIILQQVDIHTQEMAIRPRVMHWSLDDIVCQVSGLPCKCDLQYCGKSSVLTGSEWYTLTCKRSVLKLVLFFFFFFFIVCCYFVSRSGKNVSFSETFSIIEQRVCYRKYAGHSAWMIMHIYHSFTYHTYHIAHLSSFAVVTGHLNCS